MSSNPVWRSEAFLTQRVVTAAQNPIHFTQDLREVRENSRTYLVLQKTGKFFKCILYYFNYVLFFSFISYDVLGVY